MDVCRYYVGGTVRPITCKLVQYRASLQTTLLPVRARFAATCHNTGQADAEKFTLLLSGKNKEFYATCQMKKGRKTLPERCFVRFVKTFVCFRKRNFTEVGVRKAKEV